MSETRSSPEMRTSLGRVRGLGSAKEGVEHWWVQRLTAVALIPLTVWFVASIVGLAGAPYPQVAAWIGHPVHGTLLVLLLVATFHHAQLGLQVVVEDYVHNEGTKLVTLLLIKGLCWLLALGSALAVLKLMFGR